MQTLLSQLGALTDTLLKVSVQGSIVILLVFAIQRLGGTRLSPRVRYALWLLALVRLLPLSLPAAFSIFNFSPATSAEVFRAAVARSKSPVAIPVSNNGPAPTPAIVSVPASAIPPSALVARPASTSSTAPTSSN